MSSPPSWHEEQTAAVGLTLTSLVGSVSIVAGPVPSLLFVSNVEPSTFFVTEPALFQRGDGPAGRLCGNPEVA
jgi:hypothetical protein